MKKSIMKQETKELLTALLLILICILADNLFKF